MVAKYASEKSTFGKLLLDPHFWAPAIAVGAGAAATGVASSIHKLIEARRQAKAFREMLELHPQLKTRDQALVKRIYTSLHNVNPMMARDPMVAGAWTDTIIESGGLDQSAAARALLEGVKDLAQIRSSISQATQRETNFPKTIGANVSRMIEHGFARGKELEREYGDLAAAHKQIREIQEAHIKERANRRLEGLTKAYDEAANRVENLVRKGHVKPERVDEIINAVIKKYSSAMTPGQRLIAACRR
jgi:hypothetical protein